MKKLNPIFKLGILTILLTYFTTCFSVYGKGYNLGDTEKFISKLNDEMPKLMNKYNIPGASIGIVEEGKIQGIYNYGMANKKDKVMIDDNTVFQVASISKSITSWGIMKLVEEGKIDLDMPVQKYLTRWKLPESEYNTDKITVRTLLSHTSGLSGVNYAGYSPKEKLPTIEESLSGENYSKNKVEIIKEAGEQFKYSGGGYTILQLIVEEVTGMTFEDYMKKEITDKLTLNNSSFVLDKNIEENISSSYGVLGNEIPGYMYTEKAAAGLFTTTTDLCKFMIANLEGYNKSTNSRTLISKESINLIHTPVKNNYGLGYVTKELENGYKTIGHGGSNRGWRSNFTIIPEKNSGIVILTNSDNGTNLLINIMSYWEKYSMGESIENYKPENGFVKIIKYVSIGLFFVLSLYMLSIIVKIRNGKRVFISKVQYKSLLSKVIRIIIPVLIGVIWWVIFYGQVVIKFTIAPMLPYECKWITWAVITWCILFAISGIFPKEKVHHKIYNNNKYN